MMYSDELLGASLSTQPRQTNLQSGSSVALTLGGQVHPRGALGVLHFARVMSRIIRTTLTANAARFSATHHAA